MNLELKRWSFIPIRVCLLISLLFVLYLAATRAAGAWYFRQRSPEAIQTATKWDPANPEYYDVLATLMHLYASGSSNEITQLYEHAVRLSPRDAQFWADLGAGYDWAGRSDNALEAFERARALSPNSPEINWRLANFYVRARKIPEALQALRVVLLGDTTAGRKVFTLAANATGDRKAVLEMLPHQAPIFFDYLRFRIEKGDMLCAEETWARLLQLNLGFDLPAAFPYLDALIQHRQVPKLVEAWSALAEAFPRQIQGPDSTANLITNGSFRLDMLNGGLDWRVVPTKGAVVGSDFANISPGGRALRIIFDGSNNLDYGHVFQYVPVQPSTRYRFSVSMRAQGITSDSGPRFQVCDAYNVADLFLSTENLTGTSAWSQRNAEFVTKPDTHLLLIRVARLMSSRLDNKIAGTVWIADVSLYTERKPD
jgi:Tfp pilus assembly protein PilF